MNLLLGLLSLLMLQPERPTENQDRIFINSRDFHGYDGDGRVVYSGDVNLLHRGVRLRAENVEATSESITADADRQFTKIVADGDVYYLHERRIARSKSGVYDIPNRTITLTGDVILPEGCNVSTGSVLVIDLNKNTLHLRGGDEAGRVKSLFYDMPDTQPLDATGLELCDAPEVPGDGPKLFQESENG